MLLVGCTLVYFAIRYYKKTKALIETGIKTKAKVVELVQGKNNKGYVYRPIFEYTTKMNEKIRLESYLSSSSSSKYRMRDEIDVVYSKENSNENRIISFWGLYRWTLIFLAIAAPILVVSIGYFLYLKG